MEIFKCNFPEGLVFEGFVCFFDLHNFLVAKVGRHIVDVIQTKSDR